MATVSTIVSDIATLAPSEKAVLKGYLVDLFAKHTSSLDEFVNKERFSGGLICPICGKTHISRNGHRKDGTQRYICRDCGRSFVASTNTIVSSTKKKLSVWEKYIDCMMNGMSVRKTASACGIHRNTAFAWRALDDGSLDLLYIEEVV